MKYTLLEMYFDQTVLAMGPTFAGSGLAEDGSFLWLIKIHSTHFLQKGSKAVGPMS
jgi:hypothetical protein